eukprot:MONOS_14184.1-p1 / transcript=MONOS_14184.1 / gene=MONOS_14184 / organism=Monocercomonoides_exilis_PA203 / gene_product=unspecified product / transcript_product=unspecified product / location=Mono_scaffold00951:20631-22313(+) / protein_length=495 / sequence_SO=supercontig / SO=protein_coding / is_pseudo=false
MNYAISTPIRFYVPCKSKILKGELFDSAYSSISFREDLKLYNSSITLSSAYFLQYENLNIITICALSSTHVYNAVVENRNSRCSPFSVSNGYLLLNNFSVITNHPNCAVWPLVQDCEGKNGGLNVGRVRVEQSSFECMELCGGPFLGDLRRGEWKVDLCEMRNMSRRAGNGEGLGRREWGNELWKTIISGSRFESVLDVIYGGIVGDINSGFSSLSAFNTSFIACSHLATLSVQGNSTMKREQIGESGNHTFSFCIWNQTGSGAFDGGALAVQGIDDASLSVISCTFQSCTALSSGGAVFGRSFGAFLVSSSAFANCTSPLKSGGGVCATSVRRSFCANSTNFTGCSAGVAGGGLHVSSFAPPSSPTGGRSEGRSNGGSNSDAACVVGCQFEKCCVAGGMGGGSSVQGCSGVCVMGECWWVGCESSGFGGGLHWVVREMMAKEMMMMNEVEEKENENGEMDWEGKENEKERHFEQKKKERNVWEKRGACAAVNEE